MKYAVISAFLFLITYVLANGGLGEHPAQLLLPMVVAMVVAFGVGWAMPRKRGPRPKYTPEDIPAERPVPGPRLPTSPPRPGGARKLF